ncbi:hydroxyethylthiazole kinase [Clostridium carnis]
MQIGIRALGEILNLQEKKQPLIHCISNLVNINDLAQGILGYNGIPIIANGVEEVNEITSKCNGLLLNLDNLDSNEVETMEKALRVASRKGLAVILDIVGIDISFFRRETALRFLTRYKIDVVKGNLSEFRVLMDKGSALEDSEFLKGKLNQNLKVKNELRKLSRRFRSILVIDDEERYITDGFSEFLVEGYHKNFKKVTGTNFILGGLIAVAIASAKDRQQMVQGTLVAVMTMGVSEKLTLQRKRRNKGLETLKRYLLDEISLIDKNKLNSNGKILYGFTR